MQLSGEARRAAMRINQAGGADRVGAKPSPRPGLVIVKLGGSLVTNPHLRQWLAAIAAEAGAVAVVPGGGPFANAVRHAQSAMRFDDVAAQEMAMMAIAAFGRAMQSL